MCVESPRSSALSPLWGVHEATETPSVMNEEESLTTEVPAGRPRLGCIHCGSLSVLHWMLDHFGERICKQCRDRTEEYRLLSKSSCKSNYLLAESDLRDLPYVEKPNPSNVRFRDMKLYLTKQVRSRALKKWGSLESIAEEQQRRRLARMRSRRRPGSSRSVLPELDYASSHAMEDDDDDDDSEARGDGKKKPLTSAERLGSFFGIQLRRPNATVAPHSLSVALSAERQAAAGEDTDLAGKNRSKDSSGGGVPSDALPAAAMSAAGWASEEEQQESTVSGTVAHTSLPPSRLGETRGHVRRVDTLPAASGEVADSSKRPPASSAPSRGTQGDSGSPPASGRSTSKDTAPPPRKRARTSVGRRRRGATQPRLPQKRQAKTSSSTAGAAVPHEHNFDPSLEREGEEEGVRIKVCSVCGMQVTYEVL